MTTEERRKRIQSARESNDSYSSQPQSAQADALIVIADVLTELADCIKICGHGYIEATCSGVHAP